MAGRGLRIALTLRTEAGASSRAFGRRSRRGGCHRENAPHQRAAPTPEAAPPQFLFRPGLGRLAPASDCPRQESSGEPKLRAFSEATPASVLLLPGRGEFRPFPPQTSSPRPCASAGSPATLPPPLCPFSCGPRRSPAACQFL